MQAITACRGSTARSPHALEQLVSDRTVGAGGKPSSNIEITCSRGVDPIRAPSVSTTTRRTRNARAFMAQRARRNAKRTVIVNDKMQKGATRYVRTAAIGRNFDPEFKPELTPRQMLRLRGCRYMTDARKEFPPNWFARGSCRAVATARSISSVSTPASRCRSGATRGWLHPDDPRRGSEAALLAITWAAGCRPKTGGRSSAGRPSAGISGSNGTAEPGSDWPGRASGTPPDWGWTTAARSEASA